MTGPAVLKKRILPSVCPFTGACQSGTGRAGRERQFSSMRMRSCLPYSACCAQYRLSDSVLPLGPRSVAVAVAAVPGLPPET